MKSNHVAQAAVYWLTPDAYNGKVLNRNQSLALIKFVLTNNSKK
jgi:hypothetical protein